MIIGVTCGSLTYIYVVVIRISVKKAEFPDGSSWSALGFFRFGSFAYLMMFLLYSVYQ